MVARSARSRSPAAPRPARPRHASARRTSASTTRASASTPDDLVARLAERDRQRQADVAEPDDSDLHSRCSVGPRTRRKRAPRRGRRRTARGARRADSAPGRRARPRDRDPRARSSPRLDGLDPLRGVAQRHARHAEQIRLLLHAARVREHRARVASELQEVEVAERRRRAHVGQPPQPVEQPGVLEPRAGCADAPERPPAAAAPRAARPAARAARAGRRCRPVRRDHQVAAGLEPELVQRPSSARRRRRGRRATRPPSRRPPDAPRRATPSRSRFSPPSRSSRAAASLAWSVSTRFSSSGIARSNERMPGLHVADRNPGLARRRARRRAWSWCPRRRAPGRAQARRAPARAPPGCARSARCSCREPASSSRSGAGTPSSSKKIARQLVVVVLAGVDDQLLGDLAQPPGDRGRLDELRTIADDRDGS